MVVVVVVGRWWWSWWFGGLRMLQRRRRQRRRPACFASTTPASARRRRGAPGGRGAFEGCGSGRAVSSSQKRVCGRFAFWGEERGEGWWWCVGARPVCDGQERSKRASSSSACGRSPTSTNRASESERASEGGGARRATSGADRIARRPVGVAALSQEPLLVRASLPQPMHKHPAPKDPHLSI